MKKIITVLAIVFSTSCMLTSCKSEKQEDKKEQVVSDEKTHAPDNVYQCPMKCEKEKTYPKEGNCPVCKMKLKKKEELKVQESK